RQDGRRKEVAPMKRLKVAFCLGALIAGAVVAIGTFNTSLMAAERSVALALEVSGTTMPVVEPYDELLSGQVVELSAKSEIKFLHYGLCETVILKGGRIEFGEMGYAIDQGTIVEAVAGECPTKLYLNQDEQVGGVVFRSARLLRLSERPNFMLIGRCRDHMKSVRISRSGKTLFEFNKMGDELALPSGTTLEPGGNYLLELDPGTSADVLTHEFEVDPVASQLTLIRGC
ncbi:MAG: hypothetical protein VB855_13670, partial [Pirellulaceae bacterium]